MQQPGCKKKDFVIGALKIVALLLLSMQFNNY